MDSVALGVELEAIAGKEVAHARAAALVALGGLRRPGLAAR